MDDQNNLPAQAQEQEQDFADYGDESYDADIEDQSTAVAATNSSKIMGIIILIVFAAVVLYVMLGSGEEESVEEANEVKVFDEARNDEQAPVYNVEPFPEDEVKPLIDEVSPQENPVVEMVELEVPELPTLSLEEVPSASDFDISPEFAEDDIFSELNQLNQSGDDQNVLFPDEVIQGEVGDNLNSDILATPEVTTQSVPEEVPSIMLKNGFTGDSTTLSGEALTPIAVSEAEQAQATRIEFPERTIAEGKLIDAVLETAVNTDLEGKVRAIVSRDIFADFGRQILVPRGSRLIGSYDNGVQRGQTRVLITWNRLIRPDAIDIQIGSPATDQFGRSGVGGSVDNKYLELFNNSILLSLLTVGTALAVEEISSTNGQTTETDSSGDETTTVSVSDIAGQTIISDISDTAETVLDGILNTAPTITIPHGTRIKVFVNRDLVFPDNVFSDNQNELLFIK